MTTLRYITDIASELFCDNLVTLSDEKGADVYITFNDPLMIKNKVLILSSTAIVVFLTNL